MELDRAHRGHGRIEPCHCPCAAAAAGARRHQLHAGRLKEPFATVMAQHEGGASRPCRSGRPTCSPSATTSPTAPADGRDDDARQAGAGAACASKLPAGTTWDAARRDDARRDPRARTLFPTGFLPLPHPNHPEGGMLFPKFHIDEIKKQEGARPDALRPRLRPARPPPARVPAADLPDHAARPRRRLARASSSRSTTSTSCSTAS